MLPSLTSKAADLLSSSTRSNPDPSSLDTESTLTSPTLVMSLSPKVVAPKVTLPVNEIVPVDVIADEPLSIAPNPLEIAPAPKVPTEVTCVCEASTPITELEAVNPVPENRVATSARASFA